MILQISLPDGNALIVEMTMKSKLMLGCSLCIPIYIYLVQKMQNLLSERLLKILYTNGHLYY